MRLGYDNKKIAKTLDSPLSTIQTRTRLIFENGIATSRVEPDYARIGHKKGFPIVCPKGGKTSKILDMLREISGIISISANVGTLPIICTIVYHNTEGLWELISKVEEIDNVEEVLWSEEVYHLTTNKRL